MLRAALLWGGFAAALNLAWEIAQLPLYALYEQAAFPAIAYSVAHCAVGDVLVSLACYAAAALALGDWRWPLSKPLPGIGIALATGVIYTVFSEWLNVSVRGTWAYAPAMPTLFGIGLSPLVQWLVVPAGVLLLVRLTLPRWESSNLRP